MTEKKNNTFLNFTVFAVAMQAVMLALICIADYGIAGERWNDIAIGSKVIGGVIGLTMPIIPIITFFVLKDRKFMNEYALANSTFQLIFWTALSAAVSIPVIVSIEHGNWFIPDSHKLFLGQSAVYLYLFVCQAIFAAILLIRFIAYAVMSAQSGKGN